MRVGGAGCVCCYMLASGFVVVARGEGTAKSAAGIHEERYPWYMGVHLCFTFANVLHNNKWCEARVVSSLQAGVTAPLVINPITIKESTEQALPRMLYPPRI